MTTNLELRPDERLILVAALGDGDDALAAWRTWRDAVDFDHIAGESVRLVPLLYRNLARLGVDARETVRYASVYRHTWARNRLAFQACAGAVRLFTAHGIDTLLLKGAALTLLHYRDIGMRSMDDVDVLVPPARAEEAMRALVAHGWTRVGVAPHDLPDAVQRSMLHGCSFQDPRGRSLDLHWFATADARVPGADDALWRRAVPVDLEGTPTRALAPTELLYTVIAHSFASHAAHARWVADAVTIVRGSAIDWPHLVALACSRRMVLPIAHGLRALAELGAPVPAATRDALQRQRVTAIDRLEYEHRVSDNPLTASKVMLRMWTTHRRSTQAQGLALALAFPRFVARYYQLPGASAALPHLAKRAVKRVREVGL